MHYLAAAAAAASAAPPRSFPQPWAPAARFLLVAATYNFGVFGITTDALFLHSHFAARRGRAARCTMPTTAASDSKANAMQSKRCVGRRAFISFRFERLADALAIERARSLRWSRRCSVFECSHCPLLHGRGRERRRRRRRRRDGGGDDETAAAP